MDLSPLFSLYNINYNFLIYLAPLPLPPLTPLFPLTPLALFPLAGCPLTGGLPLPLGGFLLPLKPPLNPLLGLFTNPLLGGPLLTGLPCLLLFWNSTIFFLSSSEMGS